MTTSEIDGYIQQFDDVVRGHLEQLRKIVRDEVPKATENLSYGLIGYKLNNKPLVYFGGFKNHIGLYATPNGHDAFRKEFSKYRQGKGSVQFPIEQPLPLDLVKRVVAHRKKQIGS